MMGYGVSKSRGGTLAISCFSRTAELNICCGETRVTSQFVAISGGIVGYPRANDTVASLSSSTLRREAIYRGNVRYRHFFFSVGLSSNNFCVWDLRPDVYHACNLWQRCRNDLLYLSQLFERFLDSNISNLRFKVFIIKKYDKNCIYYYNPSIDMINDIYIFINKKILSVVKNMEFISKVKYSFKIYVNW